MEKLDFLFCFIDQWGRRNDISLCSLPAGATSTYLLQLPGQLNKPAILCAPKAPMQAPGFLSWQLHLSRVQMQLEVYDLQRKHFVTDKLEESVWQLKSDRFDFYIKIVKHSLDRFILIW